VVAGDALAVHQVAVERLGDDVVDERALAATAYAGDADERAERDLDVDVFEIVVAGADDAKDARFRGARREARVFGLRISSVLAPRAS
jgi:hypothetical protein